MNWPQSNNEDSDYNPSSVGSNKPPIPCRPFIKWAGGKSQLLPEILKRLPPKNSINTYHEPFIGGGAVFFALQPKQATLSDINVELINAYQVVRDSVDLLINELKTYQHTEEFFYSIRNIDRSSEFSQWDQVRRAARLIYLNKTCYNGLYRVNSKGHFNTPFGRYNNPNYTDSPNLSACSTALANTAISCAEFNHILERAQTNDFVYFDPPYVPTSATSDFTSYSQNGFGLEQQKSLYDVCCKLDQQKTRFMLSNSAVPFITHLYAKFRIETVQASRAINSKAAKRGPVNEVLVRNY